MVSRKVSRRRFVASTAAASTALVAAPFVRGAYAAGKLSLGLWDHWVPGANKASEALIKEWADKEKVDVTIDLHHLARQQVAADDRGGSAGEVWSRHARHDDLPAGALLRPAGADERRHGAADQAERRCQRDRRVSRQDRRQVAGRAGDDRQPDEGPVLAHRPHEAARRHRRAGDVSRRRAAQGGRLDPRHLPQGCRGLPEGRTRFRHRARHDLGLGRYRGGDLPQLRRRAGRRQGRHHGQERQGPPGARLLQEAGGIPAGRRGGVGRRLQQQVADVGQGRLDHEPAERLGGRQARCAEGRRAVLDARLPVRSGRPLRSVHAVLLGHLELQQEPVGGQEPPDRAEPPARPRRW